jgi:hypothetical protein
VADEKEDAGPRPWHKFAKNSHVDFWLRDDLIALLPAEKPARRAWLTDAVEKKLNLLSYSARGGAAGSDAQNAARRANAQHAGRPRIHPPKPAEGEACCALCVHAAHCAIGRCEQECLGRPARPCPTRGCDSYATETGA